MYINFNTYKITRTTSYYYNVKSNTFEDVWKKGLKKDVIQTK